MRLRFPLHMLLLALACGSCTEKSTAPDPNAALYGTWSGVMRDTFDTRTGREPHEYALKLQVGTGGVGCWVDGAPLATGLDVMLDPELVFHAQEGAVVRGFSGVRSGDTLVGHAGWSDPFRLATWVVVRPGAGHHPLTR